jgi:hypothetical protein
MLCMSGCVIVLVLLLGPERARNKNAAPGPRVLYVLRLVCHLMEHADAAAQHSYPPVMVDYRTMPRNRRIHQTNHHLFDSEYVHVPAHHQSHDYIHESNIDSEDVPAFHPGNGIAYADDIDADNYDWEADAVYID